MKNDIDMLLQQALAPSEEPNPWLKQKIMIQAREKERMEKRKMKWSLGTAVAIVALLCSTLGVFAAVKYLTPDKVATALSEYTLAEAFQTEDAILVNESQECAEYRFTLLGIVSGKGLSACEELDGQGMIKDDRTYVVTAIENLDGSPRPDVSDDNYGKESFYISPYIRGLSILDYNAHSLFGNYMEDVIDGIQYRILEIDNIEMFAKRGLYLGVSDGASPNVEAFVMDEESGVITPNNAYEGVNVLFELPIPKELGDEAAVEKYVQERETKKDVYVLSEEILDEEANMNSIMEEVLTWTLEDFEANATCIHEEELTVSEDGYISFEYSFTDGAVSEITALVDELFIEKEPGFSNIPQILTMDPTYIATYELLENGNVKLRIFECEMK